MALSALQSSLEEESFTKFWGHLVTMFRGHTRQSQSSASSAVTSSSIDTNVSLIKEDEGKLFKNSRQWQNKINMQEAQIKSLKTQNKQLQGLLDPKLLVSMISQAVTTSLKLRLQLTSKGGKDDVKGAGFISKPYLEKPRPSQLAPGTDGSLNPELECWYCKDTGHLKDNCIKLNCWLAYEQKAATEKKITN